MVKYVKHVQRYILQQDLSAILSRELHMAFACLQLFKTSVSAFEVLVV